MALAALVGALVIGCGGDETGRDAHTAREVESRLFAPCCWVQTLDVHRSELADELRAEIEARVAAGEAPTTIEDDLTVRYGERIRAVPRDVSSASLGVPFVLVGALGVLGLWLFTRRLVRRAAPAASGPGGPAGGGGGGGGGAGGGGGSGGRRRRDDEEREERLDDELLEID